VIGLDRVQNRTPVSIFGCTRRGIDASEGTERARDSFVL
jgi:hypothetical protein